MLAIASHAADSPEMVAKTIADEPAMRPMATDLAVLSSGETGLPFPVSALVQGRAQIAPDDPNWPTLTYLVAEVQRRRGATDAARTAFRQLAVWAAADPYGDTWGGSGLGALGLWRWLQIIDRNGPAGPDEVQRALEVATALSATRLYRGMVRVDPLQPGLPQLNEAVTNLAAHVAWKNNQRDAAKQWFLNYLTIASTASLDDVDRQIRDDMIASGMATPARLELFRNKRLLTLVSTRDEKDKAAAALERLWGDPNAPADVRAEAGYEWATYKRTSDRVPVLAKLDSVLQLTSNSTITEKALYRRATVNNREKNNGDKGNRDVAAFRRDMATLLEKYPEGQLADDALEQLATDYMFEQDLEQAQAHYAKLRKFDGSNDFADTAYYMPAIALIGLGPGQDLQRADALLAEYLATYANGAFRQRALFWRGRIAEQRKDIEQARGFFEQAIEQGPYTYYGIRARMHRNEGEAASRMDLPPPGSETRAQLQEAWRRSTVDENLTATSPYADRLRSAVTSGTYGKLLGVENTFNQRLDDVPLATLDAEARLPAIGLLLALRQDALAARDREPSAAVVLQLAGILGQKVGDWPLAIGMLTRDSQQATPPLAALQADPHYLATAYPVIYDQLLKTAAWPIDGSPDLSRSLMYAVMRNESQFYARAISSVGALGLFQFLPTTFEDLNNKWKVTVLNGPSSLVDYLLDPAHNINLWARWAKDDLKIPQQGQVDIGLMEHQAGPGNVKRWRRYWDAMGAPGDLEYRIETARFGATRVFVRSVLADLAIADSTGLFANTGTPS